MGAHEAAHTLPPPLRVKQAGEALLRGFRADGWDRNPSVGEWWRERTQHAELTQVPTHAAACVRVRREGSERCSSDGPVRLHEGSMR